MRRLTLGSTQNSWVLEKPGANAVEKHIKKVTQKITILQIPLKEHRDLQNSNKGFNSSLNLVCICGYKL